jgi:DNA-binding NarL/FixJ family response regulator
VLKSSADDDIVEACRAAIRGQSFLYPAAVNTLVRDFRERADNEARYDPVTPRELEVLELIAEGKTSKEIADRADLLHRLGTRDRVDLTRYAIRRGLIEPWPRLPGVIPTAAARSAFIGWVADDAAFSSHSRR